MVVCVVEVITSAIQSPKIQKELSMVRSSLCMFTAIVCAGAISLSAADLEVGSKAPDFSATGIDGKSTKLSSRFGDEGKNVVLLFSRASW
jgi:hypothetical protein